MIARLTAAALLAGTMLAAASPAAAQTQEELRAELAAMRSRIAELEARVAAMDAPAPAPAPAPTPAAAPATPAQQAAAAAPAESPAPTTTFRGAPQITAPGGWSFKPRGRLQYDVAYVGSPRGISDPGLGFSNELRRARLGVEGTMPGGFGYVVELDVADGVEFADAFLSYQASDHLTFTAGQHNNFQGIEELTSSRFTTFIERAAYTDAFNFERRAGLSATYNNGPLTVQAGGFTDNVHDLDDENDSAGADARIIYAPKLGETQLHLAANAHYRSLGDTADAGTRYRQRPLVHSTDTRFIATPTLTVERETSYGLEAALIRGPFHIASEAHWLRPGLAGTGADPTFFGAYAEAGFYLTGETRGYRGARWDRTRVRRPVGGDEGGFGALQVNVRYDHLDLTDAGITGGTQDSVQASLIWIPQDYVRFLLNYGRLSYDDAALAAEGGDRDYSVDVVALRAQIDF